MTTMPGATVSKPPPEQPTDAMATMPSSTEIKPPPELPTNAMTTTPSATVSKSPPEQSIITMTTMSSCTDSGPAFDQSDTSEIEGMQEDSGTVCNLPDISISQPLGSMASKEKDALLMESEENSSSNEPLSSNDNASTPIKPKSKEEKALIKLQKEADYLVKLHCPHQNFKVHVFDSNGRVEVFCHLCKRNLKMGDYKHGLYNFKMHLLSDDHSDTTNYAEVLQEVLQLEDSLIKKDNKPFCRLCKKLITGRGRIMLSNAKQHIGKPTHKELKLTIGKTPPINRVFSKSS